MVQNTENPERLARQRVLGQAGVAYSLAAVLPALASLVIMLIVSFAAGSGYADADWFKYLSFLVAPVCIGATSLYIFRKNRVSPRKVYAPCKWYYFAIALLLQFGLLFSLSELNEYFVRLLELIGYKRAENTLPSLGGWNLLPAILVIALLPAVFEETLFRGILVGGMREGGWGTASTVLISGALFSLFHTNPEQTLYQFVCGMGFALIALRSGSVLPSIVSHFANNAVILALTSCGYGNLTALPRAVYLALVICSAVCLAGAALFLILFDKKKNVKGGVKEGKKFFFMAAAGIGICAVEWLAILIERLV